MTISTNCVERITQYITVHCKPRAARNLLRTSWEDVSQHAEISACKEGVSKPAPAFQEYVSHKAYTASKEDVSQRAGVCMRVRKVYPNQHTLFRKMHPEKHKRQARKVYPDEPAHTFKEDVSQKACAPGRCILRTQLLHLMCKGWMMQRGHLSAGRGLGPFHGSRP